MDTLKLNSLEATLATAGQVAILLAENPSLDAMAAALGLSLALSKSGKKASVFCLTPATVALSSLVGVNKVKQQFIQGGTGLVISLPYKQGAIEKISYDIIADRINLTVVPGQDGLSFTTDDITYEMPSEKADLIFTVGIASEDELFSRYPSASEGFLVNIDYRQHNTAYGSVSLGESAYSSHSEIVAKLLTSLTLTIDADVAQNLLSGIIDATDNFQNELASPSAFEIASLLMQKGARRRITKPTSLSKDAFFEEEEQKATTSFPEQRQWGQGANGMPRPKPPVSQRQRPFPKVMGVPPQQPLKTMPVGGKPQDITKTDQGKAPKDWFEPKIYRGSTPIS